MKRTAYLLMIFFLLTFSVSAFADEQTDRETSRYDPAQGVRKLGVTHNIASDRKVENVGGLYEPEGLDKYMKRLIDNLETKITALEAQNRRMEEKLDQVLLANNNRQQLQAGGGTPSSVLQSQPNPSPSPRGRNIFR